MRPLEGIRVLDLTHVFAGPFSTYQLAVLGADVIKIEDKCNPDMMRKDTSIDGWDDVGYGTHFHGQNASKRAICLNLKTKFGKQILEKLIISSDVLVQNYSGDKLAELGFSYDVVQQMNSKLIYCSLSGFGRTGPKANHPAYDVVIQAYSGLMAANGPVETGPLRVGPAVVDYGTGAQAAMAIIAALFQRTKTGKGQFIDVSMLDAALMLMSSHVVDTLATDNPPNPLGNIHPTLAGYRTYDTKDSLIMIGAYTNKQISNLMKTLGFEARADELLTVSRKDIGRSLEQDTILIAEKLLLKTADEWEVLLNDAHVPAARVRDLQEAINSEQVRSRKVMQHPLASDREGLDSLPVAAFSYEHGSPSIDRPPPKLGEHTNEVLLDLGYSEEDIEKLKSTGAV